MIDFYTNLFFKQAFSKRHHRLTIQFRATKYVTLLIHVVLPSLVESKFVFMDCQSCFYWGKFEYSVTSLGTKLTCLIMYIYFPVCMNNLGLVESHLWTLGLEVQGTNPAVSIFSDIFFSVW